MLNRDLLSNDALSDFRIIENESLIRQNPRANNQRGVFLSVKVATQRLEDEIPEALMRLDIPKNERHAALVDLDEMTINARTMYGDYDAAARLATTRVLPR